MTSKKQLREFAKNFRKTLDIHKVSEKILQIFFDTNYFKKSNHIALYYPYKNELDIKPILKKSNKTFYLPKIDKNDEMYFVQYFSENDLIEGKYGIFEPKQTEKSNPEIFDLIIVPALIIDKQGYRLGYGKGYYDKFFANNKIKGKKIVFIPQEMFIDNLPVNPNDIPTDIVITENDLTIIK